jgi:hypothetical protein
MDWKQISTSRTVPLSHLASTKPQCTIYITAFKVRCSEREAGSSRHCVIYSRGLSMMYFVFCQIEVKWAENILGSFFRTDFLYMEQIGYISNEIFSAVYGIFGTRKSTV